MNIDKNFFKKRLPSFATALLIGSSYFFNLFQANTDNNVYASAPAISATGPWSATNEPNSYTGTINSTEYGTSINESGIYKCDSVTVTANGWMNNEQTAEAGLTLSDNITVHLYVFENCSFKGSDANGTLGGGAGILVPEGSTLYIHGTGTLTATGDNEANGVTVTNRIGENGGAGAGVGTNGGNGGGHSASNWNGSSSTKMGTLYVGPKVSLIVSGGSVGCGGDGAPMETGSSDYGGGVNTSGVFDYDEPNNNFNYNENTGINPF